MPITEAEAASVLPASGWLRRYVIHAAKQTAAPLLYHFGVGFNLLGVTCPLNYGTHYAGELRANNFVLLVGQSGSDFKSTALRIGQSLLREAQLSPLIGDFPGSPEGLIDSLSATPSQLIPMSEFGRFLASAEKGYFSPIKTLLADVWDSDPVQRRRANNKITRVDNPRLSITAACSLSYLEKHTLAEDWTGGFMGRWMVLYGKTERTMVNPSGDISDVPWLAQELQKRATTQKAGWCSGFDAAASALWDTWFRSIMQRDLPTNIIGIRPRAPTIALKIAMLYGWDFGPALLGKPWLITPDILAPALAFTELHVKSLVHLSYTLASHPQARFRREVLSAISDRHGAATLGEIVTFTKRTLRPIRETLDALIEEGLVEKTEVTFGRGTAYTTCMTAQTL